MKKARNLLRRIFGTKRPKDSACLSNSNWGSIDSAPGAHDPGPGNDAGSTEPTASGKLIGLFVMFGSTFPQAAMSLESECVQYLIVHLTDPAYLSNLTASSPPARSSSSNVPDTVEYGVGQGEITICCHCG